MWEPAITPLPRLGLEHIDFQACELAHKAFAIAPRVAASECVQVAAAQSDLMTHFPQRDCSDLTALKCGNLATLTQTCPDSWAAAHASASAMCRVCQGQAQRRAGAPRRMHSLFCARQQPMNSMLWASLLQ